MASAKAMSITILLAVATTSMIAARNIPEFLHICQTRDPRYETCVSESIEYLKPYLKSGVPEYNIPSLEPLKLKKLTFTPTSSIRVEAADIDAYGASNFEAKKAKLIILHSTYSSCKISVNFPGACKIQLAKYLDENGDEKLRIMDFRMKVSVGNGTLKLDNLFGGERALGDIVNSAINNNFDLFLKELLPIVEKALSDAFQHIAGNIIQQFTFSQLFPGA
ncbi:PREDICTED: protein takeout [Wasmannia auropunctata]|uniref:protein takeout n=1 Tax=Wasmannia auropunctata TaxID=64793 RepID=UPI0005F0A4CA|nr:PREDICTED: protein takeout [Wasmannia auropunctata]